MAWLKYPIRPLQHGMATDFASLYTPHGFNPAAMNVKIDQHSIKKPWGYSIDRAIGSAVYSVILYQLKDGTRYTIYLTGTDACQKQTAAGETFSYITETYTTGTATLTGTALAGAGTAWTTAGIAAGDQFIFDDDHSSKAEPDANWATVESVGGNTSLELESYGGLAVTGAYKIRKVYSLTAGERWWHAIVDDRLCFGNGDVNVQTWSGSGYASALDSTNASRAKYGLEYANRLWLANLYDEGVRDPYLLRGSMEGNPADWTDSTAAEYPFIETDDIITGLSKSGNNIVLYKMESLLIGGRTGNATDPLDFDIQRKGIGCIAPYSILNVLGTNIFLGRDDFYIIDGDYPKAIGEKIRYKLHEIVERTEAEKVWGQTNAWENEAIWFAETSDGQMLFVWNYKVNEWYLYQFPRKMTGMGTGAV